MNRWIATRARGMIAWLIVWGLSLAPQWAAGQGQATSQQGEGAVLGHEGQALQLTEEQRAQIGSGLGLEGGFVELETPDFKIKLVKASQTIGALEPKGVEPYTPAQRGRGRGRGGRRGGDAAATPAVPQPVAFDFTPADQLTARQEDGYYHLGDLTMRVRQGGQGEWQNYSTALARHPVVAREVSAPTLAAADLTPTLPADCPLAVTRSWIVDGGKLALRFEIRNKSAQPVEIGSLGIPMIFNNMIQNFAGGRGGRGGSARSLEDAHAICSFSDPTIGMDAGYIQVTRLSGHGPALIVVADGQTPLEAYNPLNNPPGRGYRHNPMPDRTQIQQTFEGLYEWMVHSKAYAENEWSDAQPWNPPTSETLVPGATRTIGVKFLLAPEIRQIEQTLMANGCPVAVGLPGYVLPQDQNAKLFLNYAPGVTSVSVEPAGAIEVAANPPTRNGWQAYTLRGQTWGRARLTIAYQDGKVQTINYNVIKPAAQTVADMGNFLFTKAWFTDTSDPFGRAPSVMNYDRGNNRIVIQDRRAWAAGLQDEAGSGGWVAATMKLLGQPTKEEVAKLEQFVDKVIWGGMQYNTPGNPERPMWGVRKSMFYYGKEGYDYDLPYSDGDWMMWVDTPHQSGVKRAYSVARAYNYPHVVAAYWTMYRLARNHPDLVTLRTWDWYLDHAYETIKFLNATNPENGRRYVDYVDTGLMEGDVFLEVLMDMKREGWNDKAAELEAAMKERADLWEGRAYPFGSEMAWDSTGQEEVYAWTRYFNFNDKSEVTINAILGYMPTVAHWGYNGNARRYWDMVYGAAPGGQIERQIHHYGSSINALPILDSYRRNPADYYLLRVGYGGMMGSLTNIDQEGFPSAAFHAYPARLRWDTYIGDYGPNFFGHAMGTGTYVVNHPEFGWLALGGNLTTSGDWVKVDVLDSFRRRVYLAPVGLFLTLDAGQFQSVELNPRTRAVRVTLAPATQYTPVARLRIEQPARPEGVGEYGPTGISSGWAIVRGAHELPLTNAPRTVELTDRAVTVAVD